MSKRFTFNAAQVRILDIALRSLVGQTISDADKQYAASPVGLAAASTTWSEVSAVRNYNDSIERNTNV